MPRACLLQRLATVLGKNADEVLPERFAEGRDSLLRCLSSAGSIGPSELQRFLSTDLCQPTWEGATTDTEDARIYDPNQLKVREAALLQGGSDPLLGLTWAHDTALIDDIRFRLGRDIPRVVLERTTAAPPPESSVAATDEPTLMDNLFAQFDQDNTQVEVVDHYDLMEDAGVSADEAPIIKLLNLVIVNACKEDASDVHIEPEETFSRVRYRVDGVLKETMRPPKRFHNALVSRIKIMSDLDIAEKRAPQDGRMKLRFENKNVDVRVSTVPSIYGEKVVLRLLREEMILLDLEDLGFNEMQRKTYETLIARPYGIILVTGPTGSGKTTTLYTTLKALNSKAKNIITIEDPVEYQMENVNQIQVNRKAGIDFASGLKSILRQDPDIIMLGEMRDEETAAIAVKAALTGHLVFSTLHTNDAPGSYGRLQDMKIAPYLLASAIIGVVAQRLIRRLCNDCKVPDAPDPSMLRQVGLNPEDGALIFRGKGCPRCSGTGFRGRTGIYEILTPNHEVKKMILAGQLEEGAPVPGLKRMADHGREKILAGQTTVEEVCRVVRMQEVF
ncbi:MAG: GspE/PulE family protein [Planctomycetota bacterium]